MITLIDALWIPLILAFIIGALTGWWIWARSAAPSVIYGYDYSNPEVTEPTPAMGVAALAPENAVLREASIPAAAAATAAVGSVGKRPTKKGNAAKPAAKPVAVNSTAKPAPAQKMTAIGIPAAIGRPDNLLQIKGVGPVLNKLLIGLGVTRFDQIAAWKAKDVAIVDEHLKGFRGRIKRDEWVQQARLLAKGRISAFEKRYGTLDSENR